MPKYGWFIKHGRTGQYVRVEAQEISLNVTVVSQLSEASIFDSQAQAWKAIEHISALPLMRGIKFEAVDATIHDAPAPDANQEVVPTRDELLKAAYEAGAERRARHDAARKEFAEQPTGVIIPHPGEQPVVKRARVAMKTTRRRK